MLEQEEPEERPQAPQMPQESQAFKEEIRHLELGVLLEEVLQALEETDQLAEQLLEDLRPLEAQVETVELHRLAEPHLL